MSPGPCVPYVGLGSGSELVMESDEERFQDKGFSCTGLGSNRPNSCSESEARS